MHIELQRPRACVCQSEVHIYILMVLSELLLYTGSLVEINLRNNQLTGSLPVALARLPIVVSKLTQTILLLITLDTLENPITSLTRLHSLLNGIQWLHCQLYMSL